MERSLWAPYWILRCVAELGVEMLSWVRRLLSAILPARHQIIDVDFEGEEGFVDLAFPILKVSDTSTGSVSIRVLGNTPFGEMGFDIEVLPEWMRQDVDDGRLILYWGVVRYRSTGKASDRFINILAQQYGLTAANSTMKGVLEFTAVGIHTDPRHLKTSRVDMKLFLDQGPEDTYAEVYTNLDLKNKRVEFKEKDFEYRIPLLDGLSA